ncbi:intradiol ring-cleavage dioxygenase [Streptomyces sp. MI02-2A]|uniref:intradiol ring-cleavage dioxygenase n=1 Tax=Streptomyces sp. MI02-2A TaxID=3028688 RepID=UPI0029A41FBF|nr:intradiol ring-cleavage dioxygenase [Streptomyces sp. MI02-2A]MDX3257919.1 intradiol ring-cleavage dioxygenase [Streptomyces sp. MI02-2A]
MTDRDISRRRVLALGGGAASAVLGLGAGACSSPTRGSRAPGSRQAPSPGSAGELCVLTPGTTAGPYHLRGAPVRKDITDGRPGVPLTVRLTVRDEPHACALLSGAAVEIWHCDAQGHYSGSPGGTPPAASREAGGTRAGAYLRGFQQTGADGVAEFVTVFPGWYASRAPHIDVRVHTGGRRTAGTYEGGRINWTGQLFFDDRHADEVYARSPYTRHKGTRVRLARDQVYRGGGARDGLMAVTGNVDAGLLATLTVGIDTTRESDGTVTGDSSRPPASPSPAGTPGAPSATAPAGGAVSSTPPDSAASASHTPGP